ncbi:Uncharacterised protein [uncultured Flavonifractor sp.]|nr:Uncharacterised protein [uncultured Flavonifractor sp.]
MIVHVAGVVGLLVVVVDLHYVLGGVVADGDIGHHAVLVVGGTHGVDPVLTLGVAQVLGDQLLREGGAVGSLTGDVQALGGLDLLVGVVVEVLDGEVVLIGGVVHVDDNGLGAGDGAGQAVGVDTGVHLVGVVEGGHNSGHVVGVVLVVGLDFRVQRLEHVVLAVIALGAVGQQVVDVDVGGGLEAVGVGDGDGLHLVAVDGGVAGLVEGHAVSGLGVDRPAHQLEVLRNLVGAQGGGGAVGVHVVLVGAGLHGHAALLAHVVDHHGVVGALPLGGIGGAAGDGGRYLGLPAGELPGGLTGGLTLEGGSGITVVEAIVVLLGKGAVVAGLVGHGVVDVGEAAVDLHVLSGHCGQGLVPAAEGHAGGSGGSGPHGDGIAVVVGLHLAVLLAVHIVGDGVGGQLGLDGDGGVLAQVGQVHLAEGVVLAVDGHGSQLIAGVQGPVDGDIAALLIGALAGGGGHASIAGDGDDVLIAVIDQGDGLAGAAVQLDGLVAGSGVEGVVLALIVGLRLHVGGVDHIAVGAGGGHIQVAILGDGPGVAGEGAVDVLDGVVHGAEGLPLIAEGEGGVVAVGQLAGGLEALIGQLIALAVGFGGVPALDAGTDILGRQRGNGVGQLIASAVVGGVQLILDGELGHFLPLGNIGHVAGDGVLHRGRPAVKHPALCTGDGTGKFRRGVAGIEAGGDLMLESAALAGIIGHGVGGQRLVSTDDGHGAIESALIGNAVVAEIGIANTVFLQIDDVHGGVQVIGLSSQTGDRHGITELLPILILEQNSGTGLLVGVIIDGHGHIIRVEGTAGRTGLFLIEGISGRGSGYSDLVAVADVVDLILGVVLKALMGGVVHEHKLHMELVVDGLGGDHHAVGAAQLLKGDGAHGGRGVAVHGDAGHFIAAVGRPADGHVLTGIVNGGLGGDGAVFVNLGGHGVAVADVGDDNLLGLTLVQGDVLGAVVLSIGVHAGVRLGGDAVRGNDIAVLALNGAVGDSLLRVGSHLTVGADVVLMYHLVLSGAGHAALITVDQSGAQAVGCLGDLRLSAAQVVCSTVIALLLFGGIALIVPIELALEGDRLGVILLVALVVGVGEEIGLHGVVGQSVPGAGEGHVAVDGELSVSGHVGVIGGPAGELVAGQRGGVLHVNRSTLGIGLSGGHGGSALGHIAGVLIVHGVGVLELVVTHQGVRAGGGVDIGHIVGVVLAVQLAAHIEPGLVGALRHALSGQVHVKDGLSVLKPVGDGGNGAVSGHDSDGLTGLNVPVLHGHGANLIAGHRQGEVGINGLAAAAGDLVLKLGVAVEGHTGMFAGGLGAVLQLDGVGQGDNVMVLSQLSSAGVPGDEAVVLFHLQYAVGDAGGRRAALHHGEIVPHGVPDHGGDVGGDVLHGLAQRGIAVGQQGVLIIGSKAVEGVIGEGEAHSVDDAVFVLEVLGALVGIAVVRVAVSHNHQHLAGRAALELVKAQRHTGRQVGAALGF